LKIIKSKVVIEGRKYKKLIVQCDKCGGKVEKTKLKKHLGNKVYLFEYVCKICGITEWLDKEYPLLKK